MLNKDKSTKTNLLFNHIFFKRYKLTKLLGIGAYGEVYEAKNIKDDSLVAIKLENKCKKKTYLKNEYTFLYKLQGYGIPKFISFGTNPQYNILVLELLGESLKNIFIKKGYKFQLNEVCMIGIQIIERLEYIHSKYVVHRDIKPGNFLIGKDNPCLIYLIDFGFAKKYRSSISGKHINFSKPKLVEGTIRYLSINANKGIEQTRRDDLESLAFMLIFFLKGSLPWMKYENEQNLKLKYKLIYYEKKKNRPEILCKDIPIEFKEFLSHCQNLRFDEKPDYKYLKELLKNVMIKNCCCCNYNFSWVAEMKLDQIKIKNFANEVMSKSCLKLRKENPQIRLYNSILATINNRQKEKYPVDLRLSKLKNFKINNNYFDIIDNELQRPKSTNINENEFFNIISSNKAKNNNTIVSKKQLHNIVDNYNNKKYKSILNNKKRLNTIDSLEMDEDKKFSEINLRENTISLRQNPRQNLSSLFNEDFPMYNNYTINNNYTNKNIDLHNITNFNIRNNKTPCILNFNNEYLINDVTYQEDYRTKLNKNINNSNKIREKSNNITNNKINNIQLFYKIPIPKKSENNIIYNATNENKEIKVDSSKFIRINKSNSPMLFQKNINNNQKKIIPKNLAKNTVQNKSIPFFNDRPNENSFKNDLTKHYNNSGYYINDTSKNNNIFNSSNENVNRVRYLYNLENDNDILKFYNNNYLTNNDYFQTTPGELNNM